MTSCEGNTKSSIDNLSFWQEESEKNLVQIKLSKSDTNLQVLKSTTIQHFATEMLPNFWLRESKDNLTRIMFAIDMLLLFLITSMGSEILYWVLRYVKPVWLSISVQAWFSHMYWFNVNHARYDFVTATILHAVFSYNMAVFCVALDQRFPRFSHQKCT